MRRRPNLLKLFLVIKLQRCRVESHGGYLMIWEATSFFSFVRQQTHRRPSPSVDKACSFEYQKCHRHFMAEEAPNVRCCLLRPDWDRRRVQFACHDFNCTAPTLPTSHEVSNETFVKRISSEMRNLTVKDPLSVNHDNKIEEWRFNLTTSNYEECQ